MNLTKEEKAAKAAYQRKWAKKNPDKIKQYAKNYWSKVVEQMASERGEENEQEERNDK